MAGEEYVYYDSCSSICILYCVIISLIVVFCDDSINSYASPLCVCGVVLLGVRRDMGGGSSAKPYLHDINAILGIYGFIFRQ